jgi:hypothetical protein
MIINCILQAWRMRECWTNANVHVNFFLCMAKLNAFRMLIFYMLMLYPFAFKIQCHFPSQGRWSIHCMSNSPMTIWCLLRVKYDSTVTVELVSSYYTGPKKITVVRNGLID